MRTYISVLALFLAACGDASSTTIEAAPASPAPSTEAESPATTGPAPTEVAADATPAAEAAAMFLATVDAELGTTIYAGQPIEAPEVFLATGRLFCEQLDDGMTAEQVLTGYVEQLGGVPIDDAVDDDLVLAGSVLGSAVGVLCPEHETALDA